MFLSPVVDSQIPRKYELHVFVGLAFSPHSASEKWAGGRVTVAQLIPSKNAAVVNIASVWSVWSVWSWLSSSQQLFLPPSKCWLMFGPGYLEHCSGPAVWVRVLKALRVMLFPTLVGKLCSASLYNRNILEREVTCNESIHRVGVWYPGKTWKNNFQKLPIPIL